MKSLFPYNVGGSGGGTVHWSDTIFVDAVYGTSGGAKGDASKPFLTIAQALAAASSGDSIYVRSGSYTVTDTIAKNGISMYCEMGVVINRTNGTNIDGIIDDKGSAMTFTMTGFATLNYVSNGQSSLVLFGCVNARNANSLFRIDIETINMSGTSTSSNVCAIVGNSGTMYVNYKDMTVAMSDASSGTGVAWTNGEMVVEGEITTAPTACWGVVDNTPTGDFHFICPALISNGSTSQIIYCTSSQATAAMWVECQVVKAPNASQSSSVRCFGGKIYVNAQKLWGDITVTGGICYVTAIKLQMTQDAPARSGNALNQQGGTAFIDIQHYEPNGYTGVGLFQSGGTAYVRGGQWTTVGNSGAAGQESYTITVTGQPTGGTGAYFSVPVDTGTKKTIGFSIDGGSAGTPDITISIASTDDAAAIATAIQAAANGMGWVVSFNSATELLFTNSGNGAFGSPHDGTPATGFSFFTDLQVDGSSIFSNGLLQIDAMNIDDSASTGDTTLDIGDGTIILKSCQIIGGSGNDLRNGAGTLAVNGGFGAGATGNFRVSGTLTQKLPY